MDRTEGTLDAPTRAALIAAIQEKLRAAYVFPEVGEALARALDARLAEGGYDALTGGAAFAASLTGQLQGISRDKHLRVLHDDEPQPMEAGDRPGPAQRARWRALSARRNFGFARVERLDGNVGYLDLRSFASPEDAGDLAAGAMALLAHTGALIVDLRRNGGGSPAMVALLTTYLFDAEPVHLNSLYWREGDRTQQWWTLPYVPGRRYTGKPVFVLTSRHTFSGGEEFANNLKVLGRATLIGEVTAGGANPGGRYQLTPHFAIFVPTGRAINPITGTSWEGTGVAPDIAVPADEALHVAHGAALREIAARLGAAPTGADRLLADEVRDALAALERGGAGA